MNFSTRDDSPNGPVRQPDFSTVTLFEQKIAEFFGAPYGVATDSCTHALELCLRYLKAGYINSPTQTYLSIPMLANKIGIKLRWSISQWKNYYAIYESEKIIATPYNSSYRPVIYDAATLWQQSAWNKQEFGGDFVCLSFQKAKHLSIGRAGMILTDNKEAADILRLMSYDGRDRIAPWREQDVSVMGYHYYLQPELALLGLSKLDAAIATPPRIWSSEDYPDISKFKVFNK